MTLRYFIKKIKKNVVYIFFISAKFLPVSLTRRYFLPYWKCLSGLSFGQSGMFFCLSFGLFFSQSVQCIALNERLKKNLLSNRQAISSCSIASNISLLIINKVRAMFKRKADIYFPQRAYNLAVIIWCGLSLGLS